MPLSNHELTSSCNHHFMVKPELEVAISTLGSSSGRSTGQHGLGADQVLLLVDAGLALQAKCHCEAVARAPGTHPLSNHHQITLIKDWHLTNY